MKNTRVVLVQRHPLLGEVLLKIFQGVENLDLSYLDGDDPQQIERCLADIQPDIVVLAGEKEDDAATHLISNLLKHFEDIPILWVDLETNILRVFTSHSLTANSTELIRAIRYHEQHEMEIHLMEKKDSKGQRR